MTEEEDTESGPGLDSANDESLPKIAQILNSSETFHKINDKFNNFLEGFLDIEKNKTRTTTTEDPTDIEEEIPYNDQTFFLTKTQSPLLDRRELYLTQFESSTCLLYTSPSPRDKRQSRMPSSA